MSKIGIGVWIASAWLMVGCVQHISEYEPKRRAYSPPVDFEQKKDAIHPGSLFNPMYQGTYLFADQRAMRLGDIVTVKISEKANAKRGASTELGSESETDMKLDAFFGVLKLLNSTTFAPGTFLDAAFENEFKGSGTTTRSESLEATVPATVREVLPNGNLFIEGHRDILVNSEEHHFYISGVIRPVDIEGDNSVESSLIADAEIEFTGRGIISEKQSPGWLNRTMNFVSPF